MQAPRISPFLIFTFALLLLSALAVGAPGADVQGSAPGTGVATGPTSSGSPCYGCPQECEHGEHHHNHQAGMPPMMEGMKRHMEAARKTMSELRDHEKKLEAAVDAAEFRKEVLLHLRMLDDLEESHVKHMESMFEEKGKSGEHGEH